MHGKRLTSIIKSPVSLRSLEGVNNTAIYDRKGLLKRLDELAECSGAKQVDYEIDDKIVLPNWVQKRVRDCLYGLLVHEDIRKAESIFTFCNCTIASIEPFAKEKVICLTKRKGDVLKIRFTLVRTRTAQGAPTTN